MTILDEIIARKKIDVAQAKQNVSIQELEFSPYFKRTCISATESICNPLKSGIIAEHKRKSPSKGIINPNCTVIDVVEGYEKAGASCISVLTDEPYFGGTISDLLIARNRGEIPLLRKDFIVDEYQIVEAKSIGADFILLIAACLQKQQVQTYAKLAKSLGLQILLEVHTKEELDVYCPEIDMVGVNNRNLKDFSVDIARSIELYPLLPNEVVKITESGLHSPQEVKTLKKVGFQGFLMGENFMKHENPGQACKDFSVQIR
ncbi:MAG TPA: indole-3-glycerol phosphate synthase TrpC [Bacteroidales bacterium]|nr:indole-3-glycerol phosphate synthase TrpC [Bacteroidales bacterium]